MESTQLSRAIPSKTIGAFSMFVITTPKALMIVPKNTTLSTSSSFNLT